MIRKGFLVVMAVVSAVLAWDEPVLDTNIRLEIKGKDTTFYLKKSWIKAAEARKTSDPAYAKMFECVRTLPSAEVEKIVPGRKENPTNVKRVERLFTEAQWEYLFPVRDTLYTYTKFLRAIGKFPAFCDDYKDGRDADAIALKCLATAFAHFGQETGGHEPNIVKEKGIEEWRQGLMYVRELGCSKDGNADCLYNSECAGGNDPNNPKWELKRWPCPKAADGKYPRYYGRGAKQLSYHYNYGAFSEAMYGDASVLLKNPELVADTWLNLASAIFFFVTPRPPKPSMLHVIDGTWKPSEWDRRNKMGYNFGTTINIINGGVECGDASTEKAQAVNRGKYYREFAKYFNVPVPEDEMLGCKDQIRFDAPAARDSSGMGNYPVQWDLDSKWNPSRPYGNFECVGVPYESAYSAFRTGDYEGCVTLGFGKDGPFPDYRKRNIVVVNDMDNVGIIEKEKIHANGANGIVVRENPVSLDKEAAIIIVKTGAPALVKLAILDPVGNLIDMQDEDSNVENAAVFGWDLRNFSGVLVGSGSYIIYASVLYENGSAVQFKTVIGVKK